MEYSICNSGTGETIIRSIDLPQDQVENLSSDNAEGHFIEAGIDEGLPVYALLK